ncbi:jg23885 [Pararge aegeria aegeria]|uniref:Jg23885 protein n=1 Tax=Pararge aegeria aegeria TaxID=348720 RepID=A0A8S4QRD9_9NEOP|nr:jg23885 [Pararge aegeria aegeria]
MIKEESQEEVKVEREGVEEDTHTETDDDTPMEFTGKFKTNYDCSQLSREEDKEGKKRRDYSRKKKSDSRTCSGSESAPESPSASDAERQHRLWRKSVMLVYSRLCAHKYASLFLRPITDEEAPGYSVVVKRPMDLTTIRRNIDAGNIRYYNELAPVRDFVCVDFRTGSKASLVLYF